MNKDVQHLKEYLQNRLDNLYFPSTRGTIAGYSERFSVYAEYIKSVDMEVKEYANNILKNSPHEELTEIFKQMLIDHVNDVTKKFKGE